MTVLNQAVETTGLTIHAATETAAAEFVISCGITAGKEEVTRLVTQTFKDVWGDFAPKENLTIVDKFTVLGVIKSLLSNACIQAALIETLKERGIDPKAKVADPRREVTDLYREMVKDTCIREGLSLEIIRHPKVLEVRTAIRESIKTDVTYLDMYLHMLDKSFSMSLDM